MNYLIIGGSGFIGKQLTKSLLDDGHLVVVKTRNKIKTQQQFESNDCAPVVIEAFEEMTADLLPNSVICLAGAGIVDKRWSKQRKKDLISSRVEPLESLSTWMNKEKINLDKLLVGSAIGYYGYGSDPERSLTEVSEPHEDFVHQICQSTEAQAEKLNNSFTNIVNLRTGVVLGKNGGALTKMALPAKFCMNGKIGDGQQWVSWIHIDDWIGAVKHVLNNTSPAKNYNLSAPNPVRNKQLSSAIGASINRKIQLPVPLFSLKLMLGEAAILLAGSQKVLPEQLLHENFEFQFSNVDSALSSLL